MRTAWMNAALVITACSTAPPPAAPTTIPVPTVDGAVEPTPATRRVGDCPAPESRGEGYPPWELRQRFDLCIRGREGRWTVEEDPTDVDGWRHFLIFEGVDGAGWKRDVISPKALARRTDGHVVLLDLKDHISLFALDGELVWRKPHPDCGAIERLAVGWDHTITFTCGYSVLHTDADGTLLWHKWPFGDHHAGGPLVDRAGTIYLTGDGDVVALDAAGEEKWKLSTGHNRALGALYSTPAGNLIFDTGMAERHTDGDIRIYHPHEPNELFEVTRDGAIVSRTKRRIAPDVWPTFVPLPPDGSHRYPLP